MNGRDIIIVTFQYYFQAPENTIHRFSGVCNLLMSGLVNSDYEIQPVFEDLEAEINTLARSFLPGNPRNLATIQNDLWNMVVNWWNTAKWARQEIRAPMEKEDLIGDLLSDIVHQITNNFGEAHMRTYYTHDILQALIQMDTTGNINDPFLRRRLPRNIDLNNFLEYYRQLAAMHGFGNQAHVLLQFLLDKKNRNDNRHSKFKVQEYQLCCQNSGVQSSFNGYVCFRGLNIGSQLFDHYERLFRVKYGI